MVNIRGLKMNLGLAMIILTYTANCIPIPQGAGVGQGCDAIFDDADTGSGLAVEYALENGASTVSSLGLRRRQGAGVGKGCDAIFDDADTGSGLAVEYALENGAHLVSSTGLKGKRQANKIGAGVGAVLDLIPGAQDTSATLVDEVDAIDDNGTQDSAAVGQQIGELEVTVGTQAGNLVPSTINKRQANKMGAGVGAVLDLVPGMQGTSGDLVQEINVIDDDGTQDSAAVGQQIGTDEVTIGTQAGQAVPSKITRRAPPPPGPPSGPGSPPAGGNGGSGSGNLAGVGTEAVGDVTDDLSAVQGYVTGDVTTLASQLQQDVAIVSA